MKIMLHNIIQVYTQLKIEPNRIVICHLFIKLKKKYPEDTILCIIKPLNGITNAGNHWFETYLDNYKKKLDVKILSYNACLLITKDKGINFGIIGL